MPSYRTLPPIGVASCCNRWSLWRTISWLLCCLLLALLSRTTCIAEEAEGVSTSSLSTSSLPVERGDASVSFTREIAPVLFHRCRACHNDRLAEGGFRVTSYRAVLSKGESGVAIVPGDSGDSLLCQLLRDGSMPKDADPLTEQELELIEKWVDLGARLDDGVDGDAPLIRVMPRQTQPKPPECYPVPVPVIALAAHPNGKWLASGGYHEILLWSLDDGMLVHRFTDVAERVNALAFDPTGKQLAACSGTPGQIGELQIFAVESGQMLHSLAVTEDELLTVAYSPDGKKLAAGGATAELYLLDVDGESYTLNRQWKDHADWINDVRWSQNGQYVVTASRDKTAKVYDVEKRQGIVTFRGHGKNVIRALFVDGAQQVVSAGDDLQLRKWNIEDGKEVGKVSGFATSFTGLLCGNDSELVTSTLGGCVRVHEHLEGKMRRELLKDAVPIVSLIGLNDNRFCYGDFEGTIHIIDGGTGEVAAKWLAIPRKDQ
ncbi:MAG: c-type cytochrome domain-containing protein [Pirellulaceae bacterium]